MRLYWWSKKHSFGIFYLECDAASVPVFWGSIVAHPRRMGFHLPYCENLRLKRSLAAEWKKCVVVVVVVVVT